MTLGCVNCPICLLGVLNTGRAEPADGMLDFFIGIPEGAGSAEAGIFDRGVIVC